MGRVPPVHGLQCERRVPLASRTWWPCCQSSGEMCGFHCFLKEPFVPVFIIESARLVGRFLLSLCHRVYRKKRERLLTFYNQTSSVITRNYRWQVPACSLLYAAQRISSTGEAPGLRNDLIYELRKPTRSNKWAVCHESSSKWLRFPY